MKNIHWPAIGAAAMSVVGFLAMNSDTIARVVPAKYSTAVVGAGIVAQLISQSAKKETPATTAAFASTVTVIPGGVTTPPISPNP